jgi:hypothetical protein
MKTIKLAIIALLTVHGLIHTIGFAGTWGLTEFGEPSRVPTNIVTAHPDDPIVRVLGFVWLLALIGFLVAAYLLLVNGPVWRPRGPGRCRRFNGPGGPGWHDAAMGADANALIIVAVVGQDWRR